MSYEEIESTHLDKSQQLQQLEELVASKLKQEKILDEKLEVKFKRNNVKFRELDEYLSAKKIYASNGFDLKNASLSAKTFNEVARLRHSPRKIASILDKTDTLEEYNKKLQASNDQLLTDIDTNTRLKTKTKEDLDSLQIKLMKYKKAHEVIVSILELGEDPLTIILWNNILHKNNTDVFEFEKKIQEYTTIENLMSETEKRVKQLTENELRLAEDIKQKQTKKHELEAFNKNLEKQVISKLDYAIKTTKNLEITNPLRLVRNRQPIQLYLLYPSLLIFLEDLKSIFEEQPPKNASISRYLEYFRSEIERELSDHEKSNN